MNWQAVMQLKSKYFTFKKTKTLKNEDPNLLLRVKDLGVKHAQKWVVKNVDLNVRRGEIVTLIGPNGAGKSTCIKAILNLVKYETGDIEFIDNIQIGYVPQKMNIDWTLPLTVKRLMTLTGRHKEADIQDALEKVGISHLSNQSVQTLSGGEFQRALLARAIIRKPDLLILDEPVQSVDFSGEIELYELIRNIRDMLNCGILLISHDLHIVMAETDYVICLNKHICCSGHPTIVAQNEEYKRLFGPKAANAFAIYSHDLTHDHSKCQNNHEE